MKYILGISCFIHDSSAALTKNGEIIAACEEERLNRVKHSKTFPVNAIKFCLKKANIKIEDIDVITFYMKPTLGVKKRIPYILKNFPKTIFFAGKHQAAWWNMMLLPVYFYYYGVRRYNIMYLEHVLTHAASAYYPSPFEEAAILCIEGCGEWSTTFLGIGRGTSIERVKEIEYPHSLGFVYGAVTQFLGFRLWDGGGCYCAPAFSRASGWLVSGTDGIWSASLGAQKYPG